MFLLLFQINQLEREVEQQKTQLRTANTDVSDVIIWGMRAASASEQTSRQNCFTFTSSTVKSWKYVFLNNLSTEFQGSQTMIVFILDLIYFVQISRAYVYLSSKITKLTVEECISDYDGYLLQVEGKKGQITNLEQQIDELKKRSSNQLDEISRLEDQVRNMTIEHTSMQSQIQQLQSNVSTTTTV